MTEPKATVSVRAEQAGGAATEHAAQPEETHGFLFGFGLGQLSTATSDLQNAENVRSQAEKRLETQRKDLTRNWGG